MNRKQYLLRTIRKLFQKKPTLTGEQIYSIFENSPTPKYKFTSVEEAQTLLDFVIFDLEMEEEVALPSCGDFDTALLTFLEEPDNKYRFFTVEQLRNALKKHPQTITRHLQTLIDQKKVQVKPSDPPEYKIRIDHFTPPSTQAEMILPEDVEEYQTTQKTGSQPKKKPLVVCPHCKTAQGYSPRKGTKRYHRYCINPECKKHFEITLKNQKPYEEQLAQFQTGDLNPISNLNGTDKAIYYALYNDGVPVHLTQAQLESTLKDGPIYITKHVRKFGKHRSTISRHVRKLVTIGIVEEINLSIKVYQLVKGILSAENLKLEASEDENVNILNLHHVMTKIPFLSESDYKNLSVSALEHIPDARDIKLKPMGPDKDHPNWIEYSCMIQDLFVRFTTKNVFFNTFGSGRTSEDAWENLQEKTKAIKTFLQAQLPIVLGDPELKPIQNKTHYVPLRVSTDQEEEYALMWEDNSHKGTIETNSQAFADRVMDYERIVQTLTEKVIKLENTHMADTDNQQSFNKLEHNLSTTLSNQIMKLKSDLRTEITNALVPAIKEAFSSALQHIPSPNPVPNGNYFT